MNDPMQILDALSRKASQEVRPPVSVAAAVQRAIRLRQLEETPEPSGVFFWGATVVCVGVAVLSLVMLWTGQQSDPFVEWINGVDAQLVLR